MITITIISLIIGIITFIRVFLLDKEYGEFSFNKIERENNILGKNLHRYNFSIKNIKSDIFEIEFSNLKTKDPLGIRKEKEKDIKKPLLYKPVKKTNIKEGEKISVDVVTKSTEILITFYDKFNNKYYQKIKLKNGDIKITKRRWFKYTLNNLMLKYFR